MKKKLKIIGISTLALILVLVIGIGAVFFGENSTLASSNNSMNILFMK